MTKRQVERLSKKISKVGTLLAEVKQAFVHYQKNPATVKELSDASYALTEFIIDLDVQIAELDES
jgi:hypothetical protein